MKTMTTLPDLPPIEEYHRAVDNGDPSATVPADVEGLRPTPPARHDPERIADLFAEFMHREGARDRGADFADYLLDGLADPDTAESEPEAGSPLDSLDLVLALAELVDVRATIRRLLRRLDDDRSGTPGPATLHHHLDRADRLITGASDRLARHQCVGAVEALSASVRATMERGLSEVQAAQGRPGGVGRAGGRADSVEAPKPASYWPGAVEVQP